MKISAAVSDSTPIVLIYGAEGRGKTTLAAKFPKHCLASAFAHLGRDAEAREAAARQLEVDPGFTISAYVARAPGFGTLGSKLLIEGLRKAGLPE